MFRPLPFILILVVMLTSIGLGAARGTVRQGAEVVLCTGHGVVVTILPDGQGQRAHVCPDMALALLAAVDAPGLFPPQRAATNLAAWPALRRVPRAHRHSVTRVRDPPAVRRA